ncbi:MAG: response regulator [Calditrichia bacterium]
MEKSDIKILVVEDEEFIRMMFCQSFENWGFQVEEAENGKEALEKIQEGDFNIVVTDLNMPIMDGMELLRKTKEKWPYIEVIVITGFATIESAIEAMKIGAYDFILKPVNFEHVQFTINKCFKKIKSQAENTELMEMNTRLRELNELKDKFIYITNHELRTPLTIIKGYIDILETMISDNDEDTREVVDILKDTTEELNELVERIHLLGNIENSIQLRRKSEVIELKRLITKIYKELHPLFIKRKIELKIFVDKKPLLLEGDPRQIRIVLRELLQNALKFTPDGGKVVVRLEIKNQEIQYSVSDNGIGIPLDKQEIIFDPFYEIQNTINHRSSDSEFMGGGMGIGLSLVREIVNLHKGQIHLESEPGKGTLFTIKFPLYNPQKVTATSA